ncbi:type II toxin-antitoxin system VapC family toxin [Euzebya sp.]|uniref:type II toxin-antitoxin system VapC family toxin n=1 Tax=Euzebya sp. TaxID=1971409 RepID=UPI003515DBE7
MIFVDTNVVMYAVGRSHPLRAAVRERLIELPLGVLATSAEVMQELMHAYLPVSRHIALDAAFRLIGDRMTVWPVEEDDVRGARRLANTHAGLDARDLLHLAMCRSRAVDELWTYDRGLAAAFAT